MPVAQYTRRRPTQTPQSTQNRYRMKNEHAQNDDNIIQIRMDAEAAANDIISSQDFGHTITQHDQLLSDDPAGNILRERLLQRARDSRDSQLTDTELAYRASQLGSNRYKVDSTQALREAAKQETTRREKMFRRNDKRKHESRIERHQRLQSEKTVTSAEMDTSEILQKIDQATSGSDYTRKKLFANSERREGRRLTAGGTDRTSDRHSEQGFGNRHANQQHRFTEPGQRGYDPYA